MWVDVGAGTIGRGELDIVTSLAEGASSSAMLVYPLVFYLLLTRLILSLMLRAGISESSGAP